MSAAVYHPQGRGHRLLRLIAHAGPSTYAEDAMGPRS